MAKRSIDEWNSELDDTKEFYETYPELEEPKTILLELQKDIHLIIEGKVTGKTYIFDRGGSIVDVDKADAEIMLTKMSGYCNCPGGVGSTPYFKIAR
jgi:hypothetical protein